MGMDDASEWFDGNVLSLVTEQNFERMFQCFSTICLSARISGGIPTAGLRGSSRNPGVGPCHRWKSLWSSSCGQSPIRWKGPIVLHFFNAEMQDPNALKQRWAFLPASYLLPLLAKVSSVENSECVKRRSGAAQGRPKK